VHGQCAAGRTQQSTSQQRQTTLQQFGLASHRTHSDEGGQRKAEGRSSDCLRQGYATQMRQDRYQQHAAYTAGTDQRTSQQDGWQHQGCAGHAQHVLLAFRWGAAFVCEIIPVIMPEMSGCTWRVADIALLIFSCQHA
jgi:hypothetical protein